MPPFPRAVDTHLRRQRVVRPRVARTDPELCVRAARRQGQRVQPRIVGVRPNQGDERPVRDRIAGERLGEGRARRTRRTEAHRRRSVVGRRRVGDGVRVGVVARLGVVDRVGIHRRRRIVAGARVGADGRIGAGIDARGHIHRGDVRVGARIVAGAHVGVVTIRARAAACAPHRQAESEERSGERCCRCRLHRPLLVHPTRRRCARARGRGRSR